MPRIQPLLSQSETLELTGRVWELGKRCQKLLEQEIIPAIHGGADALQNMIDAVRAADVIPEGEMVVSVVRTIPDDEEYKLGYHFYQLAFYNSLFQSLETLIIYSDTSPDDHPALSAYRTLKQCHEERHTAIDTLVERNLPLIVSCAKRHVNPAIELRELLNEGSIALMGAIDRYNPHEGTRLSTFVVRPIHWRMSRVIQHVYRTVRIPPHVTTKIQAVSRAEAALMQRFEREPTRAEIAAELGISEKEVEERIAHASGAMSLDAPIRRRDGSDDDTETMHGQIPDPRASEDVERIFSFDQELKDGFLALPKQVRNVIQMYYYDDMTLEQIGGQLNLSRGRISQLVKEGCRRLRRFFDQRGNVVS